MSKEDKEKIKIEKRSRKQGKWKKYEKRNKK